MSDVENVKSNVKFDVEQGYFRHQRENHVKMLNF